MRGQAFVTLNSKQAAAKAVKEVKGFPLYGKPMVGVRSLSVSLSLSRASLTPSHCILTHTATIIRKNKIRRARTKEVSRGNGTTQEGQARTKEQVLPLGTTSTPWLAGWPYLYN
jgi:RNA recognition motif-containing protein